MRFLFLLLFIPFVMKAQSFQKEKLDTLFARLDRYGKFMGNVALYKDGQLLYQQAVGYVDTIKGRKADLHTKYRVGSITKSFTAVLIMKAVEEKKLSLDDKLANWFPSIRKADSISIRQMMGHRSGITNFTDAPNFLSWNAKVHSQEQILEKIIKGGSKFSPGTSFDYSNSGYFLLGMILEKIYQRPYAEVLYKKIIRPLKLKETSIGGKIDPVKNECRSFLFTGLWLTSPETDLSVPFSAGNIISTANDICLFAEALFNGKIVSAERLREMETFTDHVGLGLFEFPYGVKRGYGHTGGIDAFSAVYGYFKDGRVNMALLSNGTSITNNDISVALISAAYGDSVKVPDFSVKQLSAEELNQYVGVYSSKQIPLKLTFTVKKGKLVSQATGQAAFEVDALGDHVFTKDQYGIRLTFDPARKRLLLKQGAATFAFEKDSFVNEPIRQ